MHEADKSSVAGVFSRRKLFAYTGAVGATGLTASAAAAGDAGVPPGPAEASPEETGDEQLAFHGAHQPGIVAPVQAQGWLTAFDLKPATTAEQVRTLLQQWTVIAATTMAGRPLASNDDAMAYGRGPSGLSVTVGVGASLLRRLGLDRQIPEALAPLPAFRTDALDVSAGDGDLGVLVGANDGLVAAHALRAMQRAAAACCTQRWQIDGFADAAGSLPSPTATPRNLMGLLDGPGNPEPGTPLFNEAVYVPADGKPAWMRGGSYLVYRKIRMLLDDWDTLGRAGQEKVIGRDKLTGAPLSGGTATTAPNYGKLDGSGALAIPLTAHVRLASAELNGGATIGRRSFSYYNGLRPDGALDAGQIFLAFQVNPADGFTAIQSRLAGADSLNSFIRHEASALFAVLPGCAPGDYLGRALLESASGRTAA
jgi:dye decolorizing peroxidase